MRVKLRHIVLIALTMWCCILLGCADKNMKIVKTDKIECEVLRCYRNTRNDNTLTYMIEVYDTEFAYTAPISVSKQEYSQIKAGSKLPIGRVQKLNKKTDNYQYSYNIVYQKPRESDGSDISSTKSSEVSVEITNKYREEHSSRTMVGNVPITNHYYTYYITYNDAETGRSAGEDINETIYNKVSIGDSYKATRESIYYTDGSTVYKYKLKYSSN